MSEQRAEDMTITELSPTASMTKHPGDLPVADAPSGDVQTAQPIQPEVVEQEVEKEVHKPGQPFLVLNGSRYPLRRKIPASVTAEMSSVMEQVFKGSGLQDMTPEEQNAELRNNPEKYQGIWGTNSRYLELSKRLLDPTSNMTKLFIERVEGGPTVLDEDIIEMGELATEILKVMSGRSDPKQ